MNECIGARYAYANNPKDAWMSVIPRLHDEAGSTSWLYERSSSQIVEPLHRVNGVLLASFTDHK